MTRQKMTRQLNTNLNEEQIKELIDRGFNRCTYSGHDLLFVCAGRIGLEVDFYKTSNNVSRASWNGEKISNRLANKCLCSYNYIDLVKNEIASDEEFLLGKIESIVAEVTGIGNAD